MAPGIVGHIHQHVFCARLDMEVDGPNNTVVECNTFAKPIGPENPYGNAFFVEERPLETELQARRDVDFSSMRYWKIINPDTRTGSASRPATSWRRVRRSAHSPIPTVPREGGAGSSSISFG